MSAVSKQQRVKGDTFLSEAKSTLEKKTWFSSSAEQKYEDAAELFQKAANAYKVGGLSMEAGDAYAKAADIFQNKLKNSMEATKALTDSGKFFFFHIQLGIHAIILLVSDTSFQVIATRLLTQRRQLSHFVSLFP